MEDLKPQTMDELFDGIYTGESVMFSDTDKSNDDIFRRIETESIEERSRRAAAYMEAAKIYLTF